MSLAAGNNNGGNDHNGGGGKNPGGGGGKETPAIIKPDSESDTESEQSEEESQVITLEDLQEAIDAVQVQQDEAQAEQNRGVEELFELEAEVQRLDNNLGDFAAMFLGRFARFGGRVDRLEAEQTRLGAEVRGLSLAVAFLFVVLAVGVAIGILRGFDL